MCFKDDGEIINASMALARGLVTNVSRIKMNNYILYYVIQQRHTHILG